MQHPDYRSGALPIELYDHNNGLISKPYLLYHKSCFLSIGFQDFKIQAIEPLLSMFYWYFGARKRTRTSTVFLPMIFKTIACFLFRHPRISYLYYSIFFVFCQYLFRYFFEICFFLRCLYYIMNLFFSFCQPLLSNFLLDLCYMIFSVSIIA